MSKKAKKHGWSASTRALHRKKVAKRQAAKDNQLVVPGGTLTQGQLGQEAGTAAEVSYGPAERQALGVQRDTTGWYDSYLNEMKAHTAATVGFGQQAVAQQAQFAAGARGFDRQNANQMQGAAQAAATPLGATADPSLMQTASNASSARQALLASFGQQQAGTNAANNIYADTRARVVAPGQKLRAQAQAAGKVGEIATEKGAYTQKYRQDRIADELKNVLSAQALGVDLTKAKTAAAVQSAKLDETTRHNQAQETIAQQNAQTSATKAAKSTGSSSSSAAKKSKLTSTQTSAQKDQIDQAVTWIKRLSKTAVKNKQTGKAQKLTSSQIRQLLQTGGSGAPKIPKDLVNAAYDLAVLGHLSPANVRALHKRGLSIKDLGYMTGHSPQRKKTKKNKSLAGKAFDNLTGG